MAWAARGVAAVALVLTLGVGGCEIHEGEQGMADPARSRDAAPADGGTSLLGATAANPADAGGPAYRPTCPAPFCDPRLGGQCPGGTCALRGEVPTCGEPGLSLEGERCEHADACAPGLSCVLALGAGVCRRLCCPGPASEPAEPSSCPAGTRCGGSGQLVDGTTTEWGSCEPIRRCELFGMLQGCELREACYIVDADGHTECRIAGTAQAGEACRRPEDCGPKLFCGLLTQRCVPICQLDQNNCEPGARCIAQAHSPRGTGFCMQQSMSGL